MKPGTPSTPIRIGLVQINNSFSGQCYLPYSVGLIQAYLLEHFSEPSRLRFLLPLYVRTKVDEAVESLREAEVVFFSVYVWNFQISLEIARKLKAQKPGVQIIFGGPHVPDHSELFLKRHPYINLAVHGEGEETIRQWLEKMDAPDLMEVPGISWVDAAGNFHTHPKGPRIKDINIIPSPYLSGVFEPLMKEHPRQKWIALWETNRGCPFSCTFCDWGSSTQSRVYQFNMDRLNQEVQWFADRKIDFVFCCDANFGILPRDLDIVRHVAEVKAKTGFPTALSVQNTKNATERAYEVQKALSDAGLNKGVTLSMQSMDKQTLVNIKRQNISSESYQELQRRFTRDRVETYSDLILGLPGETFESLTDGISKIIENGQHNRIQFNNLSILPNAEMGNPEYQSRYGMVTIESEIINIHGSRVDVEREVLEKQQLVIATDAMPREDWVKTRAYCWMVAFLYFDKVLQIPILHLNKIGGVSYKTIFNWFTLGNLREFPVLKEVREFFEEKALDIQKGGAEYCYSDKYLGIYWPADEYLLIQLLANGKIDAFYEQASLLLKQGAEEAGVNEIASILDDAILLNQHLLKRPFKTKDEEVALHHNLMETYQSFLKGDEQPIEKKGTTLQIDQTSVVWNSWDEFCREVIWYGNKKGAYLYTNCKVEPEIAGIY